MRENGIYVANVIAELRPEDFTGPNPDLIQLRQILLERFLMEFDDGWVLRVTRNYRGALQAEDEEAAASAVILAMMADPQWADDSRYYLLREAVRAFPREMRPGKVTSSEVRSEALRIANLDKGFMPLRIKIHGIPDAGDAKSVREYASTKGRRALAAEYEGLATMIDQLYQGRAAAKGRRRAGGDVAIREAARVVRVRRGRPREDEGPAAAPEDCEQARDARPLEPGRLGKSRGAAEGPSRPALLWKTRSTWLVIS